MNDHIGCLQLHQIPQAIIAVDDAAIEVVEVGGRETTALERDQRAQVRRDHGQHFEDHPLRTALRVDEALNDLQALRELLFNLLRFGRAHLLLQLGDRRLHVGLHERIADRLGAHLGDERVVTVFIERLAILGVGEQLLHLERGLARIDDHVVLVVDHALEGARGHVEQQAEAARHGLEEPDVSDRHGELDVAHALATDARDRDFDATAIADDVLVFDALVFSAGALVVAHGAEDLLAEEAARLGLEGAVVDRLGILHLALRPFADGLGGSDGDGHAVECGALFAKRIARFSPGNSGGLVGLNHFGVSLNFCERMKADGATVRNRSSARRASGV